MSGQIQAIGFRAAMTSSLTRELVRICRRPIGNRDRARAALHLADWLGCAIAGAAEAPGRALAAHAAQAGTGPATGIALAGGRLALPPEAAAFLNGGLGNVLEMDDVHRAAILHPGPVVIPAALAQAEASGATGAALLEAILRGYEAVIRLGRSVGPGHYALWHNTATCGPLGAAMAGASLLDLSEDAAVWALGNALTQASGPWQCRHEPVMTKQLHTARAAQAGLAAARLAAHGLTGPKRMLEGAQGFYAAMCPDPYPGALTADPDGPWLAWETSFKPWPACRHAHAAIDACLALRERLPAERGIAAVELLTYGDALAFCDRPAPRTTAEAKFSLQHAAAVALCDGPPPLGAFAAEALGRPDLAALRGKVTVAAGEPFSGAYPARFGAAATAVLDDGTRLRAEIPDALGDPENPLCEDAVEAKARTLMEAAGVAPERASALVAAARALGEGGAPAELFRALAAAIAPKDPP